MHLSKPQMMKRCTLPDSLLDSQADAAGDLRADGCMPIGQDGRVVDRAAMRKEKMAARRGLSAQRRAEASQAICARIAAAPAFKHAHTVLLYRAVPGEVMLDALAEVACAAGKRVAYPVCTSESEMDAYAPLEGDGWVVGRFGILEPDPSCAHHIDPSEIDVVVCPCTAFDERGHRLGMGAGYYDRYLSQCGHAVAVAAAYQVQKAQNVPVDAWDVPMECVYTEECEYRALGN